MTTELVKEADGVVADFHVKLQADTEPTPSLALGKSLTKEIEKLQSEVATLRDGVQQLCQAVRGLVKLQAIANQKLDSALNGNPFFEVTK